MKTISASELAAWLADSTREPPLLLDVREPWEQQICCIGGSEPVTMAELRTRFTVPDGARPIVCLCHHGWRSAYATMFLQGQGFEDVYNLTGGIDAWARQIDPHMARY